MILNLQLQSVEILTTDVQVLILCLSYFITTVNMVKNPYRSFQIAKVAYFWNYVFVFYISPIIESIFFTCLCCPWIQFLVIWRKQKHGFRLSHLFFYMVFFVTYQTIYTLYLKTWDQVFPLSILPLDILFYIFQIWHLIRKVCLLQILIYIYNSFHLIFYLHIFNDINILLTFFFQTPSTTSGLTDTEKKEKIALEKKLSEMEEELKVTIDFRFRIYWF